MSKLIMMVGIPGSGKSTYAKAHLAPEDIYVSRDEIRFDILQDGEEYFSREGEVFKIFVYEIGRNLKLDKTVWVDATNLNKGSRAKLLNAIERYTTANSLEIRYLDVSLETALERNKQRTGRALVPEDAITNMYYKLVAPTYEEFENREYESIAIYTIKENEEEKE